MDKVKQISTSSSDKIREKWTEEQVSLAALVRVEDNDWSQRVVVENQDVRLCALPTQADETTDDPVKTYLGGLDVSFPAKETDPAVAVYVILDMNMKVIYEDSEYFHLTMPYIPTYLGFREIDPLERLVKKQLQDFPQWTPRAILVDGNGRWHPRRCGIACFVGVRTGIPTIGIGKTLYCMADLDHKVVEQGVHTSLKRAVANLPKLLDDSADITSSRERILFDRHCISSEISPNDAESSPTPLDDHVQTLSWYCRGLAVPMSDGTEVLAYALVGHGGLIRGHRGVVGTKNPIYVSVGHGVSLRAALETTAAVSIARIPEPVRQADLRGRDLLRKAVSAK